MMKALSGKPGGRGTSGDDGGKEADDRVLRKMQRHPSLLYGGAFQEEFVDLLTTRVFVVMANSSAHPFDGILHYSTLKSCPSDLKLLVRARLHDAMFPNNATYCTLSTWRRAFRKTYVATDRRLLVALVLAERCEAKYKDLEIDTKLFKELKERGLTIYHLYRALFFHLSRGSTTLSLKDIRKRMVWAVLCAYQKFSPSNPPEETKFTLEDWEAFFVTHFNKRGREAHQLLLSSLVELSGLSLGQISSTRTRECYSFDCTIM